MTLRVIEGWDYLPQNPPSQLLGAAGWSGSLGNMVADSQTAFNDGRSMRFTGAVNFIFVNKFLRGRWTNGYVFGMRMNVPTVGISGFSGFGGMNGVYNIYGYDVNSTQFNQWQLVFDPFGAITLINYTNGVGQIAAKTTPWVFVPGNWFYLEVKIIPGTPPNSSLEVRVNTVPVLSLPSIRLSDGTPALPATERGITHMRWGSLFIAAIDGWSDQWRVDDFYFLTPDGAVNNDFLGNVRARYMPVISNSTPLNWSIGGTSPASTNWQSVLNTNVDDTRYVFAENAGDEDFYGINPILNTPTVFGVEVGGAYKQDDATQRFVANQIRSGSTVEEGNTFATNQSYTFAFDVYELNPDTGLGFTGAEVNALSVGPKVIT